MTLCTSIETLAMTYLDDELADEELREFELHLLDCAACRGRVETERDAIADLRRRLAPPPTPDLVRARIKAALDAEDAATTAAEGGRRWTGWVLPGVASVAAFAALAMFFLMREPDPGATSKPSAASVMASQTRRDVPQVFEVSVGNQPADGKVQIFRSAMWTEEAAGREVTKLVYGIRFARGIQIEAEVWTFDSRGLDMHVGQAVRANGLVLWLTDVKGETVVGYEGSGGTGYIFRAPKLGTDDLVDLVANYLADDVGAR